MLANNKAVELHPAPRRLRQRPLLHRPLFRVGQLPIVFGDLPLVEVTLEQPQVPANSFLHRAAAPRLAAGIKADRNAVRFKASEEQRAGHPVFAASREADVNPRAVGRAVAVKTQVVVDAADRPPDARFGVERLVEHVYDRPKVGDKRFNGREDFALVLAAVGVEPLPAVVFGERREELKQPCRKT